MDKEFDEVMKKIGDVPFRGLYGDTKTTMKVMIGILREAYAAKHRRRGRRAKLDVADMLLLACIL
ncbi:MAG: hypothetical protein LBD04_01480 [Synergistaceae bacterium]|jgi:hypothetical protein|nr:hypothetical protein [Synergistaceae bacterium]